MPMLGIMASAISGNLTAVSYDSISTGVVDSSGAASITFSSIPATYTHLQLRCMTLSGSVSGDVRMQFNADTGTTYSIHNLYGTGAAVTAQSVASTTYITGAFSGSATQPGVSVIDILDYANTNKYKTARILAGLDVNGAGGYALFSSGTWRNTAAVTSITLFINAVNFNQYSSFALYGIK